MAFVEDSQSADFEEPFSTPAPISKGDKILKLVAEGEQALRNQLGQKNATLILGNSGSGKTTFFKWITDNDANLMSKDQYNTGTYIIEDTAQKNKPSGSVSDTVFPELKFNNNTKTSFYDFPGFGDSRGVEHEIAQTYMVKNVIDNVENVKIIFLVNYISVSKLAQRDDFKKLMKNAMTLMKNFDKFKDSVLLLVSKVNKDGTFSCNQIVSSLVKSMETLKADLKKEMDGGKADNSKSIQFLDAILRKKGDVYPYIGMFRTPNQEGPVNTLPLMVDNKHYVTAALDKLEYMPKVETDFGYVIPNDVLVDVGNLMGEMRNNVLESVKSYGQRVSRYFHNIMKPSYDITELYNKTTIAYNKLTDLKSVANQHNDTSKCVQEIIKAAILPNPIGKNLEYAAKNANCMSFLYKVSDYQTDKQFKCADGLNDVIEQFKKSRQWNKFLIDLHNNKLSTYEVQRNTSESPCNDLAKFIVEGGDQNLNKSSNILEPVMQKCDPQHKFDYKAVIMDEPKFNALRSLLNLTMYSSVDCSCDSNKLSIKGQYVKFSDITKCETEKCSTLSQFIQVFAADRLFFDEDFEKLGEVQLSVLAPIWDVQGSRKIVLRGLPGNSHSELKALNMGGDGKPGLAGNRAGHFFGVGDIFYNLANLTISSIGGQGGPGQHGNNGIQGQPGENAYNDFNLNDNYIKKSPNFGYPKYFRIEIQVVIPPNRFFQGINRTREHYVLEGKKGTPGGKGGNGGIGGKGGLPGSITFIPTSFSNGMEFTQEIKKGSDGIDGEGGKGGSGGKNGNDKKIIITNRLFEENLSIKTDSTTIESTAYGPSGSNGTAGCNADGLEKPSNGIPFTDTDRAGKVTEYKSFLRTDNNHPVRESQQNDFLKKLENSRQKRSAHFPASISNNPVRNLNSRTNAWKNSITSYFIRPKFIQASLAYLNSITIPSQSAVEVSTPSSQFNIHPAPIQLGGLDINGNMILANFFARCVTKMKPYNNAEKTVNLLEVQTATLDIITQFEAVLDYLAGELNLPDYALEFDPVTLISKLNKMLINGNRRNLATVLFESINGETRLDYKNFKTQIQPKIDQVLATQNEKDLSDCWVDVEYKNQVGNPVRKVIGSNSEFDHVSHQPWSRDNHLLR